MNVTRRSFSFILSSCSKKICSAFNLGVYKGNRKGRNPSHKRGLLGKLMKSRLTESQDKFLGCEVNRNNGLTALT